MWFAEAVATSEGRERIEEISRITFLQNILMKNRTEN